MEGLKELPLEAQGADPVELRIHKQIYAASDFQTVMNGTVANQTVLVSIMKKGWSAPQSQAVVLADAYPFTHEETRRGKGFLCLETDDDQRVGLEDIINILKDSMSARIYELLKRGDESYVVLEAHKNPRFVEDCVREMAKKVLAEFEEFLRRKVIELFYVAPGSRWAGRTVGERRGHDGDPGGSGLSDACQSRIQQGAAGGLLSAGGIGAILSPPVLGAAAFLIAEFLKISYLEVIVMASIPTVLYYWKRKTAASDLIIYGGSPPVEHPYEFGSLLVDVAEHFAVERIYTLGG
jgi:hypothetical protein